MNRWNGFYELLLACSAKAKVLVASGRAAVAGGSPGLNGGMKTMGLTIANTAGRYARTRCPWIRVPLFESMDDAFAFEFTLEGDRIPSCQYFLKCFNNHLQGMKNIVKLYISK